MNELDGIENRLNWITTRVFVMDLKEYEHNPRRISKKDFDKLVTNIREDGYHQRIIVDINNVIIGGHSRKRALLAAGYAHNDSIEVLRASRPLTDIEFKRLNIRDNIPFGEFDFDILANNFEMEDLIDWGMDVNLFPGAAPEFNPVVNEERLDEKTKVTCPNCQHEFEN